MISTTIRPRRLLASAILCLAALAALPAARAAGWEESYGALLAKYVTPRGVRYAAWKGSAADVQALDAVTDQIGKAAAPDGKDAKLAFYINAYNAWVLHNVLEAYPTKSVRDIAPLFGFFTKDSITVAGQKTSLNKLEKETIRALNEARVHFALNCASASCPPLAPEPYKAAKLGAELDHQAKAYVTANPKGVEIADGGKKATVSKIFDWYKDQFAPLGGTIGFINKYRQPPLPADAAISIQDYDWSLNEAK